MSTRRLMIAVALAALVAYGLVLWSRSNEFGRKAQFHNQRSVLFRVDKAVLEQRARGAPLGPRERAEIISLDAWAWHEQQLSRKYRRLSQRPWLAPTPDPPRPAIEPPD